MHHTVKKATTRQAVRSAMLALGMAWAWLAGGTAPTHAEAIIVLGIAPDSAVAGSSADSLDVTLTNIGTTAATIGSFSFELNATGPNAGMLTFTDATVNSLAAPYIFAGNSFAATYFSGDTALDTSNGGETIDASDLYETSGGGTLVGGGQTVSLGNVTFALSSTAVTPITLTFSSYPYTSVSGPGPDSANITFTSSPYDLIPATVPEPASIVSLMIGGAGVAAVAIRRAPKRQGRI